MKLRNFYFTMLIVGFLCVNATCFGQILHRAAVANDRSHAFFQLKGPVKSVIIETYDVDNVKMTDESFLQVESYKDFLRCEFNPASVSQYHFRKDGKLIEWGFDDKDKIGPLYRIKKTYKQVLNKNFVGVVYKITEFVDSEIYERDGLLDLKTKFDYNNQKYPVSSITRNNDNEVFKKGKFLYDEKDQLIRNSLLMPDDQEFYVQQYRYDNEGRICNYELHIDINLARVDISIDYQYDKYNNLKHLDIPYFDDKLSLTFDNILDHHKNWIRRTIYINDIPAYVQKKEITYY